LRLVLRVWRQRDVSTRGSLQAYEADGVSPDMSLLDVLGLLNERLVLEGGEPVAFERLDCAVVVNGRPCGDASRLDMSAFRDGSCVVIEPLRARAFPVVKDLVVDRSALDNILVSAGRVDDRCTGCGACAAACPNASAMLFAAANIPREDGDLLAMVRTHDAAGFGGCSGERVCEAVCPVGVTAGGIALLNRRHLEAEITQKGKAPA
jgi:succinate dehydrogenase / fumarate reductase iron-sulfur subunit